METFVKQGAAAAGFYEAEAAGLRWLAVGGGAAVVGVVAVRPGRIELERVAPGSPTAGAAQVLGRTLAATHAAGATAFGAPPDGWDGPDFIGSRRQDCVPTPTWGAFYAEQRVRPFARIAAQVGTLDPDGLAVVERACDAIASGAFDDDEPPARVHGDLWSGNVLWSPSGAILIDPAAHGGHRETDLAMLQLFGLPHLERVLAAYDDAAPLRAGWPDRVPLHQLHPLAVHAAGHGPSYAVAVARAARATLALLA